MYIIIMHTCLISVIPLEVAVPRILKAFFRDCKSISHPCGLRALVFGRSVSVKDLLLFSFQASANLAGLAF